MKYMNPVDLILQPRKRFKVVDGPFSQFLILNWEPNFQMYICINYK